MAQRPRASEEPEEPEASETSEVSKASDRPRKTGRKSGLVRILRDATRLPGSSGRGRRLDIQGLRAMCMIQVLGFHAWRIGSPIGVDAFIMILAYLMTGAFVRRAEDGRPPWFVERWLHTFKRLMPPLVVTVLITVLYRQGSGCHHFKQL